MRKRDEQQRSAATARDILMTIEPEDLFKLAPEYEGKYSKFDDTGLPTHLTDGTELTKSAKKKLEKEHTELLLKLTTANEIVK